MVAFHALTRYCTEPLAGMRLNLHIHQILKPVGNGKLSKRDGDKLGFPVFPWKTEEEVFHPAIEKGFFLKPL
jgi:hypothetical protein